MGNELPDDIELLKKQVTELQGESARLRARNMYLEVKLAAFLERRASRQRDAVPDGQLLLDFAHEMATNAQEKLDEALESLAADSNEQGGESLEPSANGGRRRSRGSKRGRRPLPDDLPRVQSVFELDADERLCSCGSPMPEIGEVKCEELVRLDMMEIRHDPGLDLSTVTPWAWKQQRDEDELRRQERQRAQAQIAKAVAAVISR